MLSDENIAPPLETPDPSRRPAEPAETAVAIVGAGPAGLAAAVTLGTLGIDALVIERRGAPSPLPKSTVASTGTMEILRRFGLEEEAWSRAIDVEWRALACATMAEAAAGVSMEVGMPSRAEAALVSPTRPALIGQDDLEPLLEAKARSLASVRIERATELLALARDRDGGFELALASAGGAIRRLRARYLIGADGLRSRVREELGIGLEAVADHGMRLGIRFRAPIWELVGEHRYGMYFVGEESANLAMIPAGRPDRWVLAAPWEAPDEAIGQMGEGELVAMVRESAGDRRLPVAIEEATPVSFGIGLAERFRDGDGFLVGDAAHRVTPRGGTGLNTAIRDGFDLGWKLGWVLRDWAAPGLLDSYEAERRPVAEFNTMRSARETGSLLGVGTGLAADIGGRIAHAWIPRDGGLVSSLDLLGPGLTLFAGPVWEGEPDSFTREHRAPVALERLDAISARALGLSPAGALLARPDGHPISLFNPQTADNRRTAPQPKEAPCWATTRST